MSYAIEHVCKSVWFVRFAICVVNLGVGLGQQLAQPSVVVSVNEPRPLARAAILIEQRFGVSVSYEDPAYGNAVDLVDKTDAQYKLSHPEAKVLIPRAGSLNLTLPTEASVQMGASANSTIGPILQSAINSHMMNGDPGEFKVITTAGGFSIVPTAVRGSAGMMIPNQSPLETAISISAGRRDAKQTLNLICEAISNGSGSKVTVGLIEELRNQVIQLAANNEPARDVLVRFLNTRVWADNSITAIPKLSWSLLYGPDVEMYALNLRAVRVQIKTPTGRNTSVAVTQ